MLLALLLLQTRAAAQIDAIGRALEPWIEHEITDKRIPAISIALVDDQRVVWARGFGFADPDRKAAATADTIHRVGSVSKLFTDIAVMRLVERGELDLDAPVTRYLPDFAPKHPPDAPITLRHLMAHRAGLVREPPAGNYFDAAPPSLAQTVRSLNGTELVYATGSRTKYSNAGISVVGYVLERTQGRPFAEVLKRSLLEPMGLSRSAFAPDDAIRRDLAKAVMWTSFGRSFPAPTFELGMSPAGSLYTSVNELARFLSLLFARGGSLLKPETLEQMWTPQFAPPGKKSGFGLGFLVGELDGRRTVGHDGAIYGFATSLVALPEEKLGVVVVASKDCANAVTDRIALNALKLALAARERKPPPSIERPAPIEPAEARRLASLYRAGDRSIRLSAGTDRLWLMPSAGECRLELRRLGDALVVDDCLDYGLWVTPQIEGVRVGGTLFARAADEKPAPAHPPWLGLIGEYGWDHNVLTILERDGALYAVIEWFFLYPLRAESDDVYAFPDYGLYHGEKIIFSRDARGRGAQALAAGIAFPRRRIEGEEGPSFRIQPLRPVEELRREALAARPPEERGDFNRPDLVEPSTLDPSIRLDIRYAGPNNFMGAPMYSAARAFLQRPAAEALVRAHRTLAKHGYGLLIHDGYRPWFVTKMFWEATPPGLRELFVADPSQGSRHNRGCAVDLTLYELAGGRPVEMVGGYDEMSDRSFPDYPGGSSLQRWHRDLLRRAMEAEGFTVYETEWWHFDYRDWKRYPILNLEFEQLGK
jgi:CubicO group peptidase (beta-lactamase class C family)/D-alanyl-D-alanine dipeptidase